MGLQVPIVVLQYARDPEHLGVLVRVLWILQQGLPWSSWAELGRLSGVDRHRARRACRFLQNLPSADWSDHTSQNSPVNRSEQQDTDEIGLIQYPVNSSEQLEPKSSRARAPILNTTLKLQGFSTVVDESTCSKDLINNPLLAPPMGVHILPLQPAPIVAQVPSERGPSPADKLIFYLRETWEPKKLGKPETLSAWVDSQIAANPGVDLLLEAKRARGWELSNPSKMKKLVRRYLSNWWGRCKPEKQSGARDAIEAALVDLRI